ncbi:DUF1003 domain-containing protein [Enterobacter asburiae]|jgi:uncharacterized membrane protein|uniref:DUF1003 domain-containing protein n=1 Tax=Enterobacter asburiae TaxID=61645 RepID=UPI0032D97FC3
MNQDNPKNERKHNFRLYQPLKEGSHTFGEHWFALKAEAFARLFGTPKFLVGQTVVVIVWIYLNTSGTTYYDPYPFILLNLAFSLQAAYAAPLILLAQTQQTERDQAHALADAKHREDLDEAMAKRQTSSELHSIQIFALLKQNTELTILIKGMTERIDSLTQELAKAQRLSNT